MTEEGDTETRLREVLGTLADQVEPSSDAYRRARAQWQRRERRRRLLVILLAILLVGGADAVGLWALNHAQSIVVFDDSGTDDTPRRGVVVQP